MHPDIKKQATEIARAFNQKPKNGIAKIQKICKENGLKPEEQIASFFHDQRKNLDLSEVGDYLGSEGNERVLNFFIQSVGLSNLSFTEALRTYLSFFKLPGEAQKIDRLMEAFGKRYCEQNPAGEVKHPDAAYVLAFQVIMLNTDLHNKSIKHKMTLEELKRNLRGENQGENFSDKFLTNIYRDIESNPLKMNIASVPPGYEFNSASLFKNTVYEGLERLIASSKLNISNVFPFLDKHKAMIDKPKSWLNRLMGYEGTITILDADNTPQVSIQIYKPGIHSRLFNKNPRIIVQPICKDGKNPTPEALTLAAKIAASMKCSLKSCQATYHYLASDLLKAYAKEKNPTPTQGKKEAPGKPQPPFQAVRDELTAKLREKAKRK